MQCRPPSLVGDTMVKLKYISVDKSDEVDANPFASINPNAFQQETQRLTTKAPFMTRTKLSEKALRALNPPKENSSLVQSQTHIGLNSSEQLGKVVKVLFWVCIAGMFFFVTKQVIPAKGQQEPTESVAEEPWQPTASPSASSNAYGSTSSVSDFINYSKINGTFFRGEHSAIILNGTTYRTGDVVSDEYRLVFIGFHNDREHAVFQDPNEKYYKMRIR